MLSMDIDNQVTEDCTAPQNQASSEAQWSLSKDGMIQELVETMMDLFGFQSALEAMLLLVELQSKWVTEEDWPQLMFQNTDVSTRDTPSAWDSGTLAENHGGLTVDLVAITMPEYGHLERADSTWQLKWETTSLDKASGISIPSGQTEHF